MDDTKPRRFFTWTLVRRTLIACTILAVIGAIAIVAVVAALSRDLPTIETLAEYEPPITSRVHAGDGALIAEFADEHRVYVPFASIPDHVIQAFVSAEDKKFFEHGGLDFVGMTRAAINTARNKLTGSGGLQGGSTITQQVVKNMLLTRDQTIVRKIKEAVLARRIENARKGDVDGFDPSDGDPDAKLFPKGKIIELYLNEIYLGGRGYSDGGGRTWRAYGVGSAALNYFGKSLTELNIAEAATLAALAKAPGSVNPYRRPEQLLARRSYVVNRMVEDGYITAQQAETAKARPLETVDHLRGARYDAATHFVQQLRREMIARYGEETLEQGGLSIRSTIDTRLQLAARDALQAGLVSYDRRHAYRGPFAQIPLDGEAVAALKRVDKPDGYGDWEAALVTAINPDGSAKLRLVDNSEISLVPEDVAWADETYERENGGTGLAPGDVVLAEFEREAPAPSETETATGETGAEGETGSEAVTGEDGSTDLAPSSENQPKAAAPLGVPLGAASLRQVPEVEGGLIALDPHTGRVLAMMGGYSPFKSSFNRVTQAERQPGSSFKPFVYAAALENGYTPATKVLDAPFVDFDVEADDFWSPGNYSEGRFYGLSTIRLGLEKSRNLMTVRMAQDIGMEAVSDLAARLGVYDNLAPYLAMALGAGETTPWRLAKGYATFVNGGKAITPTLLDRVQDRYGRTLYRHDQRACEQCDAAEWTGGLPPALEDTRRQVLDPVIAYQMVHLLEGVVERGTGRIAKRVGKPLAGKTGTTNDYKDALFFGFSPDLVVGVWVGFDEPRSLGEGEAGGSVAAPIFTDFMEVALKDEPALPFRKPPGVRLVQIDAHTGELPGPETETVIYEAFRPGNEPGGNFGDGNEPVIFGRGDGRLLGDVPAAQDDRGAGSDDLPATPPPGDAEGGDEGELTLGPIPDLGAGDPEETTPGTREDEDVAVAEELGETW